MELRQALNGLEKTLGKLHEIKREKDIITPRATTTKERNMKNEAITSQVLENPRD